MPEVELDPVDPERCQGELIEYRPFTMGGHTHQVIRCAERPVFVGKDKKPRKSDGLMGAMSLCGPCRDRCKKKMRGIEYVYLSEWLKEQEDA